MSDRNVELHRCLNEAFNARDLAAYIALTDPSIEFHTPYAAISGIYRGHEGARTWQRDLADVWTEIRVVPEAYFDLGEQTLAFQVSHGRGRHSGVEIAMSMAVLARWRDGLLVYAKGYADRADALRDLGVSEDELERIEP